MKLQGNLEQIKAQTKFLEKYNFIVINSYVLVNKGDTTPISLIYHNRINGWWWYKDELINRGICTLEEFDSNYRKELKKSVIIKEENSMQLKGDLNQMVTQAQFLSSVGGYNVVNFVVQTSKDNIHPLSLIFSHRIDGWWNYKDELIEAKLCTEETFQRAMKTSGVAKSNNEYDGIKIEIKCKDSYLVNLLEKDIKNTILRAPIFSLSKGEDDNTLIFDICSSCIVPFITFHRNSLLKITEEKNVSNNFELFITCNDMQSAEIISKLIHEQLRGLQYYIDTDICLSIDNNKIYLIIGSETDIYPSFSFFDKNIFRKE